MGMIVIQRTKDMDRNAAAIKLKKQDKLRKGDFIKLFGFR